MPPSKRGGKGIGYGSWLDGNGWRSFWQAALGDGLRGRALFGGRRDTGRESSAGAGGIEGVAPAAVEEHEASLTATGVNDVVREIVREPRGRSFDHGYRGAARG